MKTEIIIVRHGESLGNAAQILLGHTDMDLSPLGYKQASATAEYLKNTKIDEIHTSSLMRAYNTAKAHADLRGMTPIPNDNLREVYLGEWENLTVDQIKSRWSAEMYDNDWHDNFGTFVFPGGEGVWSAGERFYSELKKIAIRAADKTILVAAHGAVIRAFYARILGLAPEEAAGKLSFPSNASCSFVTYDGERFIPEKYSHDEYLADVGITHINF